jgi:flagellar biosynthetic protein FlhB
MSEDRTQPASKHRRQMAREQGLVVHSPELTAAAGWLVAVVLLSFHTRDLAGSLAGSIRGAMAGPTPIAAGPDELISRLRSQFLAIAVPFAIILGGFAAGSILAHQCQVRGLFAPSHVAVDPSRLWNFPGGSGLGAMIERNVWAVVKSAALIGAGIWTIRAVWGDLLRTAQLEIPDLARSAGSIMFQQAIVLAAVLAVLGLIDYFLRHRRFEAMLQTTPQQQREDQQLVEGDLSLRSRRRQIANARRGEAADILAGASLALFGDGGLVVIIAGGPPPRKVHVRSALSGEPALRLRRAVAQAKLTRVDAPALARRLGHKEFATRPIPPDLADKLAGIWPDHRI